jgi:glycosyltransferase involved in cell wall biosynthesis
MRIGIMLRHVDQHPGGVVVYTNELLRVMLEIGTDHEFVLFFQQPPPPEFCPESANVRHVIVPTPSRLLWDQVALPLAVRRERIDVLFNPKYSIPLAAGCRTVWVCHGLDWYVMPWASRWQDRISHRVLVPRYVSKADAIITVSGTVRDHALEYFDVRPEKLHVVYSGAHDRFRQPVSPEAQRALRDRLGLPERFVVFVGALYPPKNFTRLLRAYAASGPARGYHLVVAGGTERFLAAQDLEMSKMLGLQDWVHMIGWLAPDDLPTLYSMATGMLMPSLYEACPLPIIEAMATGCPIVTANRYGTAEMAGDAALLVDPESVESITDGIGRLLDDADLRADLSARGLRRSRPMTWHETATQTLRVLESLHRPGR